MKNVRNLIYAVLLVVAGTFTLTTTTNASQLMYFYSADGTLINAQDDNGNMSSYLTRDMRFDGTNATYAVSNQKDVTALLDANGKVSQKYNYTSYGVTTTYSDPSLKAATSAAALSITQNPYSYSDYYTDSESNNYYLNARYYNPVIGTFLTFDTYNLPNRYAYVNGNPVMGVDPRGHVKIFCEGCGNVYDDKVKEEQAKHLYCQLENLPITQEYPGLIDNTTGSKYDDLRIQYLQLKSTLSNQKVLLTKQNEVIKNNNTTIENLQEKTEVNPADILSGLKIQAVDKIFGRNGLNDVKKKKNPGAPNTFKNRDLATYARLPPRIMNKQEFKSLCLTAPAGANDHITKKPFQSGQFVIFHMTEEGVSHNITTTDNIGDKMKKIGTICPICNRFLTWGSLLGYEYDE